MFVFHPSVSVADLRGRGHRGHVLLLDSEFTMEKTTTTTTTTMVLNHGLYPPLNIHSPKKKNGDQPLTFLNVARGGVESAHFDVIYFPFGESVGI